MTAELSFKKKKKSGKEKRICSYQHRINISPKHLGGTTLTNTLHSQIPSNFSTRKVGDIVCLKICSYCDSSGKGLS